MVKVKGLKNLQNKWKGLLLAANRYPLTILFLVAVAVVNANEINGHVEDYDKYLLTFIVGAMLGVVSQQLYEHFFARSTERFMVMGGAIILAVLYYILIQSDNTLSVVIGVKTIVAMGILVMAFIWVPSIKSKVFFYETFMATFKAFFTTILFSAVIAAGIGAIYVAIDNLLFSIDYKALVHALNLVASLFAPIFFLSHIPFYFGIKAQQEEDARRESIKKAISCPRILEILISYIIIPLTAVYTVILLIYVLINIGGEFWTENLLEPLLVAYSITVIIVYILSGNLPNKFATLFRRVFPKVLVPIVVFQTIASMLKIQEMGITHGRYYVILFGIFATIAGLIFSFMLNKRSGLIAPVFIVLATLSIVPPIDAFTVSQNNQIQLLEKTLTRNNMLENGVIVPNGSIPIEDKEIITKTVNYLEMMNYSKEIEWLPDNVYYSNFEKVFGFSHVYDGVENSHGGHYQYAFLDWQKSPLVNIAGYDYMAHFYINTQSDEDSEPILIEQNGSTYTLRSIVEKDRVIIRLVNQDNEEWIQFDAKEAFQTVLEKFENSSGGKETLTVEEAMTTKENDLAKMTILVKSVDVYNEHYNGELHVFLEIKK